MIETSHNMQLDIFFTKCKIGGRRSLRSGSKQAIHNRAGGASTTLPTLPFEKRLKRGATERRADVEDSSSLAVNEDQDKFITPADMENTTLEGKLNNPSDIDLEVIENLEEMKKVTLTFQKYFKRTAAENGELYEQFGKYKELLIDARKRHTNLNEKVLQFQREKAELSQMKDELLLRSKLFKEENEQLRMEIESMEADKKQQKLLSDETEIEMAALRRGSQSVLLPSATMSIGTDAPKRPLSEEKKDKPAVATQSYRSKRFTRILTGDGGGYMKLWNPKKLKYVKNHKAESQAILFAKCLSDKSYALCTSKITILSERKQEVICTLEGHSGEIKTLIEISPNILISGSNDKSIKYWEHEGKKSKCSRSLSGHSNFVNCLAVSPESTQFASGSSDKEVGIWDIETGTEIERGCEHSSGVTGCLWLQESRLLATSAYGAEVNLWDARTPPMQCIKLLEVETEDWLYSKCLSELPGGRLAFATRNHLINLYDLTANKTVSSVDSHSDYINSLALLNENQLVTASDDFTMRIWDINTLAVAKEFNNDWRISTMSPI